MPLDFRFMSCPLVAFVIDHLSQVKVSNVTNAKISKVKVLYEKTNKFEIKLSLRY